MPSVYVKSYMRLITCIWSLCLQGLIDTYIHFTYYSSINKIYPFHDNRYHMKGHLGLHNEVIRLQTWKTKLLLMVLGEFLNSCKIYMTQVKVLVFVWSYVCLAEYKESEVDEHSVIDIV